MLVRKLNIGFLSVFFVYKKKGEYMVQLKINEEFENLIPALSSEEFEQLEKNIINEGCRDAIVTWQDFIIDGHNRYKICTKHGIDFKVIEKDFDNKDDVINWIIFNQFGRRNISNYNRALLALKLKDTFTKKAKENLKTGAEITNTGLQKSVKAVNTQKELAKVAGISHDTIYKVEIIEKQATEEIKEQLQQNKISINEAYKQIKAVEKVNKLEQVKQNIIKESNHSLKDNRPIVKLESYETWLNTYQNGKADLLLTDPPYSTDIDDIDSFANDWLPKALNCVKDTGMAYVFIGGYPKEVKAYLNVILPEHIRLEQILIWEYKNTLGNNPKDRYKLNYQNILFFRGVNAPTLDCPITNEQWGVQSINAPDGRLGNRFHTWQKPIELAERFIRHSTKQGDIVIDPFVCTGTFVIAANKLGRFGFGCDINKDNLDIAISRGCRLADDCNGRG